MSASEPPIDFGCSVGIVGGGSPPMSTATPATTADLLLVAGQMNQLLKTFQELLLIAREQLDIARRSEARHLRMIQNQREELQQWLGPDQLGGRCGRLHLVMRDTLGKTLGELAEYVEEHEEDLADSEFVRSELVDRYGAQLNHLSALYGLMKRLSLAESEAEDRPPV